MEENYFEIVEVEEKTYWDSPYRLCDDTSLLNELYGNFELFLGGYNLALTVDRETGECVSLSTLVMALGAFVEQEINITDYKKGKLIYHNKLLKEQAGAHQEFIRKFYYDSTKNLLCFGINDNTCDVIKFESHTYARVKNGKLYAIILEVDGQIIKQIKKIFNKNWLYLKSRNW